MPSVTHPAPILRELAKIDIAYEVRQYCRWAFEPMPVVVGAEDVGTSLEQATFTAGATAMRNLVSFFMKSRPQTGAHDQTDVVAAGDWPST